MKLFLTGFLQVFLVAINTFFYCKQNADWMCIYGIYDFFCMELECKKGSFWDNERAFNLFGWGKHWKCIRIISFNVLVLENKNV